MEIKGENWEIQRKLGLLGLMYLALGRIGTQTGQK